MITLKHAELFRCDLRARMPFRYGIATMTWVPHVILRLTFEIDGTTHTGLAADNLPQNGSPKTRRACWRMKSKKCSESFVRR